MAKHILVVDDEVNIRRLVEIHLRHAGYRVTTACDGNDALAKLRADRPDLLVSDVIMPHMDGFELLKRLKADSDTAGIPVVMLTVKALNGDIFEGWQSGVHYYLTKPFSPTELLAAVKQGLAVGPGPPTAGDAGDAPAG
jgi:DNA-binding response OmpR family regulator